MLTKYFRLFALAAAGGTAAYVAWYPGHFLLAIGALPLLWGATRSRAEAGALWLGYYLAGARDIPVMCARFFSGYGEFDASIAYALGAGLWLVQALLLASPWAIAYAARARAWGTACGAMLGTIAVSVPPIGVIGWLSPLHIASVLCPGAGVLGAATAIVVIGALAAFGRTRTGLTAVVVLIIAGAAYSFGAGQLIRAPVPKGWIAINTTFGKRADGGYASAQARTAELQAQVRAELERGARVVVLPEEVPGEWRPSTAYWWRSIAEAARDSGQTIVVGGDIPVDSRQRRATPTGPESAAGEISAVADAKVRYTDSAIGIGADPFVFDSRQPIPAGLWRPWAAVSAARGAVGQPLPVIDGVKAAPSICYEDFLWWPHWRAIVQGAGVFVAMSNVWFADDLAVSQIQQQSLESIAKIAGVSVLRAANRSRAVRMTTARS
ncbi:conjugal transfer protein TraB [Burkholderia cenocepacia]|uniref:conjugal transfer protein TraB n=1 Tax=Burkholderia cenocepacia TaxID=95486 RepID=UPI000F5815E6|nr:conjugal transfer protein TraB [Burkholderia cenocepacia]RQU97831.1 conjugal transfer protein TraB [Burkholderia cenocepacia]